MGNLFYKRYKANVAATRKKHDGKICLIIGLLMVSGALLLLPYRADNASDLCGDELKVGDAYYIENLQILDVKDVKTEADKNNVYCVAKFTDKNQNDWIISFRPLNDEHLINQINLAKRLGTKPNLTTGGYVYIDDIPGDADAFYTVHSRNFSASENDEHILQLHADYLCSASGNFTLEALMRPSLTKQAFVWGIIGILTGAFMLIKYRTSKFR